jgi:translation initiation factor 2 subunit 3
MAGDETLQKEHEDSGSEEEEDVAEIIPKVEIDPSKLTPLSPEVISKQVSQSYIFFLYLADTRSAGYDKLG